MGATPALGASLTLWRRLKAVALTDVGVLLKGGVDPDVLERFERVLIEADFGSTAFTLATALEAKWRTGQLKTESALRDWLHAEIANRLVAPAHAGSFDLGDGAGPGVLLFVGVNGVGKTTQVAKVGRRLQREGKSVLFAASDTFRAAAVEQLGVWAARLDVPCVSAGSGADPAAVAFNALEAAEARRVHAVLIDTAGRLHTKEDLMDELKKIVRVVARRRPGAPHERLLVVDGTVGQNAIQQGRAFAEAVPLTGVIVTKLDGTAKGGAVVELTRELGVPIRFLGTGEGVDDMEEFSPGRFVDRLLAS